METTNLACAEEATRSIFRLPREILATIFIYYAHRRYSGYLDSPSREAPSWVNVSYVCRQWRSAALDCPTLWSYVFVTSRRWTEELLARSKQVSLIVRVGLADEESDCFDLVEQVLDHMERIQELRIELPPSCYDRLCSKLSLPAHRLQILEICVDSLSRGFFVHPDEDTELLSPSDIPRCPILWHSFQLSSMTVLRLCDVPVSLRLTVEDFLAALSSMRDLNHLSLDRALTSAAGFLSSEAFHTVHKVNLPRLSRLLIVAPLSTVIALLSSINVPSKTKVKLECNPERGCRDYNLLSSLLPQRFSASENQALSSVIRSLRLDFYQNMYKYGVQIRFSASEHDLDSSSDRDWDRDVPLVIALHGTPTLQCNLDRVASDVCCCMPLDDVESVHVIDPPLSRTFWRKMLVHLGGVRRLQLGFGRMPDMASALACSPWGSAEARDGMGSAAGDEVRGQGLAPRLEELKLFRIRFTSKKSSEWLGIPFQDLLHALATRRLPGRLILRECGVDEFEVDRVLEWGDDKVYGVPQDSSGGEYGSE